MITSNQAAVIGQKLKDYEVGKLDLESFGEKAQSDEWRQLIGYYLLHTNDISTKAKLPVGRCYAQFNMIAQATQLGEEYVNVYSNDWRGWRLLGYCYDVSDNANKAILAYSNCAELGHTLSYEQLGGCAARNNRWDVVKSIAPQLLALEKSKATPQDTKLNVITILLMYSMAKGQKEIFVETLQGENMNDILQNKGVRQDVTSGLEIFSGAFSSKDIDEIRQKVKAATGINSALSTTNSQSP